MDTLYGKTPQPYGAKRYNCTPVFRNDTSKVSGYFFCFIMFVDVCGYMSDLCILFKIVFKK